MAGFLAFPLFLSFPNQILFFLRSATLPSLDSRARHREFNQFKNSNFRSPKRRRGSIRVPAMASDQEIDGSTGTPPSPKKIYNDPDDGRQRFLLELEFVQCLANPTYIHYLAQNRYFEDEAFIGYLKYLLYWQRPEYMKFIMYPHCLFFLELLQNANFRSAMAHPGNKELAHRQQFYFWKNYRNNRLKHILPRPLPEPVAAPPVSTAPPTTNPVPTSAPSPALSPMQYGIPSGSAPGKNDPRSNAIDRRKRKKDM